MIALRARWRAAMRGKAVSDQLFELIAEAPADTDRAILIYPSGPGERQTAIRWYGMNAEQVAMTLYNLADEVLRQRVPLKK